MLVAEIGCDEEGDDVVGEIVEGAIVVGAALGSNVGTVGSNVG